MSLANTPYTPAGRACLLRVWAVESTDGKRQLRFSLQDTQNNERRGFADFESLVAGLRDLVEEVEQSNCDGRND